MSGSPSRLTAALEARYTIERELGEGGMATVYVADDLRHERKVALKVLKPELAVEIERSPVLQAGRETVLADWSGQGVDLAYRFDLHPNGTEVVRVRSRPTRRVVLVQNWRSLLAEAVVTEADRR